MRARERRESDIERKKGRERERKSLCWRKREEEEWGRERVCVGERERGERVTEGKRKKEKETVLEKDRGDR